MKLNSPRDEADAIYILTHSGWKVSKFSVLWRAQQMGESAEPNIDLTINMQQKLLMVNPEPFCAVEMVTNLLLPGG